MGSFFLALGTAGFPCKVDQLPSRKVEKCNHVGEWYCLFPQMHVYMSFHLSGIYITWPFVVHNEGDMRFKCLCSLL